MDAFTYSAPTSIAKLLGILDANINQSRRTQILAGGTDFLVQMKTVDSSPRAIVDIKHVPEASSINISADYVYIGAAVPAVVITANKELRHLLPGLVEAVGLIGSTQIQGRASMGGNLCNASPAGDTIPAMIANSGVCEIIAKNGNREVAVEDFVTGVQQNCLQSGECLLGVRFPKPELNTADAYLRFTPRTEMDIAVVGAGVSLTYDENNFCSRARVAIGAVAKTALLVPEAATALVGSRIEPNALSLAAQAAVAVAKPISDKRGTAEYRLKLVAVLVRRAIVRAAEIAIKHEGT